MLYLLLTQQKPSTVLHLKSGTKPHKWQNWAIEAEDQELIYVLHMHVETDGAFCLNSTSGSIGSVTFYRSVLMYVM